MFSSAGANVLALHIDNHKKSSDDRPRCLENSRPAGAESTLTENVASPYQAEPRQYHQLFGLLQPEQECGFRLLDFAEGEGKQQSQKVIAPSGVMF